MKKLTLLRTVSSDKGTLGILYYNNDILCYTLELPWKDNKTSISCVPCGTYRCELWNSPKFGMTYELQDVPGRSKILIHKGNWVTDINGCVLVGMQQSILDGSNNRYSVFNSTEAFRKFVKILDGDIGFDLEIKERG